MAFRSQHEDSEINDRDPNDYWKSGRSDIYSEASHMETQQAPPQMLFPGYSESGSQINWQQLHQSQGQNEYGEFVLGLQPPLNSSNSHLLQSPSAFQDRRNSAGLISDYGYPDLSNQASPAYLDDQLDESFTDESFAPRLILDDDASLPPYTHGITHHYSPAASASPAHQQTSQFQEDTPQLTSPYHVSNYGDMALSNDQPQHIPYTESVGPRVSRSQAGQVGNSGFQSRTTRKRSSPNTTKGQSGSTYTVERSNDGSWIPNESTGHSGVGPESRGKIANNVVPTIQEQEQQRLLDERNADVEEWLNGNEGGKSIATDRSQLAPPSKETKFRRRAKSTGDPYTSEGQGFIDDSHIPGPGIKIQEHSDLEDDADRSSFSADKDDSPPAVINASAEMERSPSPSPQNDQAQSRQYDSRPWNDGPKDSTYTGERHQPATANAAMMKFYQRARDIETASLSATIGSRRRSDTDIESIVSIPVGAAPSARERSAAKSKAEAQKPNGLFTSLMAKRPNSNLLKRKSTNSMTPNQHQPRPENQSQNSDTRLQAPKLVVNTRRPRSPRIDTNTGGSRSPHEPSSAVSSSSLTPWTQAKNIVLHRSRSKSDISRSPGLTDLMTQHGGPPMLKLASPGSDLEQLQSLSLDPEADDADFDTGVEPSQNSAVAMNMEVRFERIVPTFDGFKSHVLSLNPRLPPYLADRIATEQVRRYKKLLDARAEHTKAVTGHKCASGNRCVELGGSSKLLPLRTNNKNTATTTAGFQVLTSPVSEDDRDNANQNDGVIVPAQFPSGIPIPPVERLPAEFECPLCFKVKQFIKPSDWTKHVHEDVSPFTCTFELCTETKSFKRKADWVRHENERHRHLESWNCNHQDCTHSCHRKDNFVQHLVREHALPEPKVRTGKSVPGVVPAGPIQVRGRHYKDIWELIDSCKQDTTQNAEEEPCRFCGNICSSWKKLTVHLAKHLEQISLPVLGLLEQSRAGGDRGLVANPPSAQNFGLPQQIDFRPPPAVRVPSQNWTRQGLSAAENGFPLHVDTKPDVGLAAQASFVSSSSPAHTYPPVQFNHQVAGGAQGFYQNQTSIYPGNGLDAAMARQYSPHPIQTGYSHPSSDAQPGAFSISSAVAAGSGQQSFVSSPLDTADFGDGAFAGHHTHSSTYPGS
ncbi:MAG: hypothetical protein Q9165_007662 [Trypethelium subeluteriae]